MTKRAWLLGWTTLLLPGCLLLEPTDRNPGEVRTGIYELEVVMHTDTCTPRRASGAFGGREVTASSDKISAWGVTAADEITPSFYRYDLPADDDYTSARGRGLLFGKDCGGEGTLLSTHELVAANESGFVVRQQTVWKVVRPCLDAVYSELPTESCRVDQDSLYVLREVCEAPCSIRFLGLDAVCICF